MAGKTYHLFKRRYTNKNGKTYYYWWFWYYEPVTGKRIKKPAGRACTNRQEAEDYIAGLPGLVHPSQVTTIRDFAQDLFKKGSEFLKRKAQFDRELKESTRKAYDGNIRNHILPVFGDRDMSSIKGAEIEDYLLDLEKKNSTKNFIVDTWNIIFREAKRQEVVDSVPSIQRFRRNSERYDILTDEELEKLFPDDIDKLKEVWKTERDNREREALMFGIMFLITVTAGLRSGEIRAMHRDQIFIELNGIIVNRQFDLQMNITAPKEGDSEDPRHRAVIVPQRTMRALQWWLDEYAAPNGLLFKYKGKPVDRDILLRRFRAGLKNVGIIEVDERGEVIEEAYKRKLSVHSLRYTYNTKMETILSGKMLKQFMGHLTDQMTQHYSRPQWQKRLLEYQDQQESVEQFWK